MILDRFEKALLFVAASVQAQAAINAWGPISGTHPASPDISDPNLHAVNLEEWEEFRIFYHALVKALDDDQNWPAPNLGLGQLLGDAADPNALGGLLKNVLPGIATAIGGPAGGALVSAVQGLLAPKAPAPPAGPLPNPGDGALPRKP